MGTAASAKSKSKFKSESDVLARDQRGRREEAKGGPDGPNHGRARWHESEPLREPLLSRAGWQRSGTQVKWPASVGVVPRREPAPPLASRPPPPPPPRVEIEVTPDCPTHPSVMRAAAGTGTTTRGIVDTHHKFMPADKPPFARRGSSSVPPPRPLEPELRLLAGQVSNQRDKLFFGHGLAEVLLWAYSNHCGVELTPDMLWGAFMTQLAFVVNGNMETLRRHLVSFHGTRDLAVHATSVRRGVHGMREAIRAQLASSPLVDLVDARFSTTTDDHRLLHTIALMSSLQQVFSYTVNTRCGLPCLAFVGTAEDWASVARRMAAVFEALPMPGNLAYNAWQCRIGRLAKECAAARQGHANVTYWQHMVDRHDARRSGVQETLTGWLPLTLCAFKADGTPTEVAGTRTGPDGTVTHRVNVSDMPFGCVTVPIRLQEDRAPDRRATMVAGIMAARAVDRRGRMWLVPQVQAYMRVYDDDATT